MGNHPHQPGRKLKIAEITNVDFSLRHFLLPLMRGARERGHEVVGICAEGPLLDAPREDGFRIEAVPMPRTLSPRANLAALSALVDLFRRERFDLVHAHMPISGLLSRYAAWRVGVPRMPTPATASCSTSRARGGGARSRTRWRRRRVESRM
jgi:hypothetical protein